MDVLFRFSFAVCLFMGSLVKSHTRNLSHSLVCGFPLQTFFSLDPSARFSWAEDTCGFQHWFQFSLLRVLVHMSFLALTLVPSFPLQAVISPAVFKLNFLIWKTHVVFCNDSGFLFQTAETCHSHRYPFWILLSNVTHAISRSKRFWFSFENSTQFGSF